MLVRVADFSSSCCSSEGLGHGGRICGRDLGAGRDEQESNAQQDFRFLREAIGFDRALGLRVYMRLLGKAKRTPRVIDNVTEEAELQNAQEALEYALWYVSWISDRPESEVLAIMKEHL